MTKIEAIVEAMDRAGSTKALADHLAEQRGLDPQKMLWRALRWRKYGVPPKYVLEIERLTGVSRHDLCPEIYPKDAA